MSQFNPEKSSYLLMQTPMSMYRNKSFTIIGFVVEIILELDYTKIKVLVITFRNKDEVREHFDVYFIGEVRAFVDKFAKESDLIDIAGEMIISKESTESLQVIRLIAKHAYIYRKMGTAYQQISELIKASETENDDLAF